MLIPFFNEETPKKPIHFSKKEEDNTMRSTIPKI